MRIYNEDDIIISKDIKLLNNLRKAHELIDNNDGRGKIFHAHICNNIRYLINRNVVIATCVDKLKVKILIFNTEYIKNHNYKLEFDNSNNRYYIEV